ncbi:MAG: pyridoxal 5'-phosphate synthase glutaminase subunit PdxT [Anaerolineae bacterium]
MRHPLIGVLALQGDVAEHEGSLRKAGALPSRVRGPGDLRDLDGLVIPGGESTTIGALAKEHGLMEPIRALMASGAPVWGTCAGLILLARDTADVVPLIGGLDIAVDRNAFGRQVDSFEVSLEVRGLDGPPFPAVFIRAPAVREVGPEVEVLARLDDGTIVAVAQGRRLGCAFHPELTSDLRLHRLFVGWCLPTPQGAAEAEVASAAGPSRGTAEAR